jgi:UDP-N-acetyl-2-amino-2-deoxyglucuronate dehydrogenase
VKEIRNIVKAFALIGAGGFVAPRHMRAIKAVGGDLKVAFDPNDSVGIIDAYFPDAHFFVEFERFDRHVDLLRRKGETIDYVSICSPNYLHDAHVRFALRSNAHAICEKPLVLNPWNIDGLAEAERSSKRRVWTILQLRLHPAVAELRKRVASQPGRTFDVQLTYITSRGRWYQTSWKSDASKSGGLATNIGVHFFDMLAYIFGPTVTNVAHLRDARRAGGFLECENARIRWFLSVECSDLPEAAVNKTTYRSLTIDGEEFEFSDGFTDLHTRSYEEIVAGRGFSIEDARMSIEIVSKFRNAEIDRARGECHPYVVHIEV